VSEVLLSDEIERLDWPDVGQFSDRFGIKGATSLAIPRPWTLPFALVSVQAESHPKDGGSLGAAMSGETLAKVQALAASSKQLIVRSSVVDESIWDRGTYRSIIVPQGEHFIERIDAAAQQVIASTGGRRTALMLQTYLQPASAGEFGNLQRISKTRDQWEIGIREAGALTSRQRLNSQRDEAADPRHVLPVRAGLSRERLFGSIGAWLNNELLLGRAQRLNCEWVTDNKHFFLVQIDEEDEDLWGTNPFQVRIPPASRPAASTGRYLMPAEGQALKEWDKLQVLEQLWEPDAAHKPMLFYVPVSNLLGEAEQTASQRLKEDFSSLIGEAGIVVRTSVRAGTEKVPNLARTDCLTPEAASEWCLEQAKLLTREHNPRELAFVAHRFVASRASAWCRADPSKPVAEINALWGLPDALQYCPYDIWDVHVPTAVATDYSDYKSDMLISGDDGSWRYVRVKNELARSNSIGSAEAKEIAARSFDIAERLGEACHIMWFVGCVDADGNHFSIPWYWTKAHEAERNPDRAAYRVFTVVDRRSLEDFVAWQGSRVRQALALRPTDLKLMRDTKFIEAVGRAAKDAQVPVILSGSTLAHAYYQLRKLGCTVVTPGEKEHARARRTTSLGKLVRDKIPDRIAQRHELRVTRQMSGSLRKGFLLSKLFEEALEVREARDVDQKTEELADLFEVFRALAKAEDVPLTSIRRAADDKKQKAGGFEEGLVLLQTGIGSPDGTGLDADRGVMDVLAARTSDDAAEIPFSFFGFMEMDQPRSIYFERLGVRLELTLKPDRLEVRVIKGPEQLGLPLNGGITH
jgi:predicted house-cleaning noncanonical NTP pyrophosphatase (MazG superfamily)